MSRNTVRLHMTRDKDMRASTLPKNALHKVSLDVDSERMSPESRLNKVSPLIYVKTFSSARPECVAWCIVYLSFGVYSLVLLLLNSQWRVRCRRLYCK